MATKVDLQQIMAVMKDVRHALYLRDIEVFEVGRNQAAAAKEHLSQVFGVRCIEIREVELVEL